MNILFHESNPFNVTCDNCTRSLYARFMAYFVKTKATYYVCQFCKDSIEYLESRSTSDKAA